MDLLQDKLKNLPQDPGIYMMKNGRGEIIYVGKAKVLFNRVRSYFSGVASKDLKTQVLVREIKDFEVIITKSEMDAILLERTLIRHHHPRYNVLLKDGKEYPFIRVDFNEDWPRIEKVRRRGDDKAIYHGPFSNAGYLNETLKLMGRIFPLIRCSRYEFKNAKRPCNYYHMKMCMAPCSLAMEREVYLDMVRNALNFLMGKNKDVAADLEAKMLAASAGEQFELAAQYRDQIQALREISKKQTVVVKEVHDADIINFFLGENNASFCVLIVRDGRIIGNETFLVETPLGDRQEIIESFMLQYYDRRIPPAEIILPEVYPDFGQVLSALGPTDIDRRFTTPRLTNGTRGIRKNLCEMALKNAQYHYDEALRAQESQHIELFEVKRVLSLADLPMRIECIDISNFQGRSVVASDVCFINARPAKEEYRHYIIKDLPEGQQDDFASIHEVVRRRIDRGLREQNLPDLLVIDGGKGQLNAALSALKLFPDANLKIVSIAKSRVDQKQTDKSGRVRHSYERIFLPHEDVAIPLRPGSSEYRLLTRLRDEAHRFAIQHHRKRRAKAFVASPLDEINGLGPKLKRRLLDKFGTVEAIAKANLDELKNVEGISEDLATRIRASLNAD